MTPGRSRWSSAASGRDHRVIEEPTDTGAARPPAPDGAGWPSYPGRPSEPRGAGVQRGGRRGRGGAGPPWMRHHHDRELWELDPNGGWPRGRHHGAKPWHRPRDRGPIRRSRDERLVAGVAGGLARRLGWDPTIVRVVLLMVSLSGFGVGAYVLAWLLIPADGETEPIAARSLADRRGLALVLAFLPLLVIVLLIGSALEASWVSTLAVPAIVSAAGFVLIWRNADPVEQAFLHRAAAPVLQLTQAPDGSGRSRRLLLRLLVALALLTGGLVALVETRTARAAFRPLLGLLLIIAAIVTVVGPWWLRVARDLVVDRQARARAEERAELAARVHDSVLQTLALIQRRADQPQEVVQLARAQERELRSWLFDGNRPASAGDQDTTFSSGVHRIQDDIEVLHGIAVEVVVVGDCELDDGLRSLLAAGREAAVNAAKWSGGSTLSLFGEVEEDTVSLFVRDRGVGFDPEAVAEDRKGIAESIRGRMTRSGGNVAIRSSPGAGTEVALSMSREPGRRARSARAT